MREIRIPILAYHAIGHTSSEKREIGEEIYRVSLRSFEEQIDYLHKNGYGVAGLDNLVANHQTVILTFDDGDVSAYSEVFPILQRFNFTGHFFIISGKIGGNGYMNWKQIKELKDNGHIIGSHGMTHRILTSLSEEEIHYELVTSKRILQEKLATEVKYLSIPRGFKNKKIEEMAKRIGYELILSSELGRNDIQKVPFNLKRIPIKRDWSLDRFIGVLNGKVLLKEKTETAIKKSIQQIFGIRNYDRLRSWLLQSKN